MPFWCVKKKVEQEVSTKSIVLSMMVLLVLVNKDDWRKPIRDSRDDNAEVCDAVEPDENATGFRLLTSVEWELAARWRNDAVNTVGGNADPWFTRGNSASGATADVTDEDATSAVGWFWENVVAELPEGLWTSQPVKRKIPNSLGLYDMSGNVWEMTSTFGSGGSRLVRGGSWYAALNSSSTQIGYSTFVLPVGTYVETGFRLARSE